MVDKYKLSLAIWFLAMGALGQWIYFNGPAAGQRFSVTNFVTSTSWTNVMSGYYLRTITFLNFTNAVYDPTIELVHDGYTNVLTPSAWSGTTTRQYSAVFTNYTTPYLVGDVLQLGQSIADTGMVDILVYPIE